MDIFPGIPNTVLLIPQSFRHPFSRILTETGRRSPYGRILARSASHNACSQCNTSGLALRSSALPRDSILNELLSSIVAPPFPPPVLNMNGNPLPIVPRRARWLRWRWQRPSHRALNFHVAVLIVPRAIQRDESLPLNNNLSLALDFLVGPTRLLGRL